MPIKSMKMKVITERDIALHANYKVYILLGQYLAVSSHTATDKLQC